MPTQELGQWIFQELGRLVPLLWSISQVAAVCRKPAPNALFPSQKLTCSWWTIYLFSHHMPNSLGKKALPLKERLPVHVPKGSPCDTSLSHATIFDSSSSFISILIPQSTWKAWSCVFNMTLNHLVMFPHILELSRRSPASFFPLLYETSTFSSTLTPNVSSLTRSICWYEFQLHQRTGWPRSN